MAGIFRYTANGDYQATTSFDVFRLDGTTMASNVQTGIPLAVGVNGDPQIPPVSMNDVFYYSNAPATASTMRDTALVLLTPTNAGLFLSMDGGAGVATFSGGNFGDHFIGGLQDDNLFGRGGNDTFEGAGGADDFFGGADSDTASYAGSGAVRADLSNGGNNTGDALGDTYDSIENLRGGAASDTLTGEGGANVLDGGAGADSLEGGLGDDRFFVDAAGDVVVELSGGGSDMVAASADYALAAGVEIEEMRTRIAGDTASIDLTGNEFGQTIYGNAGANVLDGRGGQDTLVGSFGDDVYFVDRTDVIDERANGGTDVVAARADYRLGAGEAIELLRTTSNHGLVSIDLIGNGLANAINGNDGLNALQGAAGADTIRALDGDDSLNGGAGADTLYGGLGSDEFNVTNAPGSGVDQIMDFGIGGDRLILKSAAFTGLPTGVLDGDGFHAGASAADAADRIIYDQSTGALFFDQDGSDGGFAQFQFATLVSRPALTAGDITVV